MSVEHQEPKYFEIGSEYSGGVDGEITWRCVDHTPTTASFVNTADPEGKVYRRKVDRTLLGECAMLPEGTLFSIGVVPTKEDSAAWALDDAERDLEWIIQDRISAGKPLTLDDELSDALTVLTTCRLQCMSLAD